MEILDLCRGIIIYQAGPINLNLSYGPHSLMAIQNLN